MCVSVIIERDGLKPVHCETVRELALWFDVLVVDAKTYPDKTLDRTAEHCLCLIDIRESAAQSGYAIESDDAGMDVVARKSQPRG